MNNQINVTKTFLPPISEYEMYLKNIWENGQLTNQGPLLREFEKQTKKYLSVDNFHFVANGTVALQLSISSLNIGGGEIITTPFSYVASVSSILWESCKPIFVDIESDSFCIDPSKIEAAITSKTKAILAVHVYGNACDVEAIDKIATKHNLKVIYDGAHAFGVKYKGKSLLSYGDISTCSFHATKLFHTIEGGCLVVKDKIISNKTELIKRFGHHGDDHLILGINAKASELHSAMGLCNLKYIDKIIESRRLVSGAYDKALNGKYQRPKVRTGVEYNYSYYPVLFDSEKELLVAIKNLNRVGIYPRRYFYPSLNKLPYLSGNQNCPVSEDISSRVLCLPLYHDLKTKTVNRICEVIS